MSMFSDIIQKKMKDWDCPELMDGGKNPRGRKIPFSSPLMQYCTYGGIPRDKITEFYGENGGGKSTTAIDICKNAVNIFESEYQDEVRSLQKKAQEGIKSASIRLSDLEDSGPKKILYIDLEHSFDSAWSSTLGIDPNKINIMQPPNVTAEDVLQTLQELVETGEVGLIVLDSLPSLVPRSELEKKYGERTVASLAGLLTVFCRKIVPMLTRYGCTLLFINQIRQNMDNPYVVKTPGGEAPKFYASLRIQFQIGNPVDFLGNELPKSTENPSGYIITAKITKQKSAPNDRKLGSYFLMCNSGIRIDMDYAQLAMKKYGFIKKSGGWFTMVDPRTGEILEEDGKPLKINGMVRVYEFLQKNTEYFDALQHEINKDIMIGQGDEVDGNETDEIL